MPPHLGPSPVRALGNGLIGLSLGPAHWAASFASLLAQTKLIEGIAEDRKRMSCTSHSINHKGFTFGSIILRMQFLESLSITIFPHLIAEASATEG